MGRHALPDGESKDKTIGVAVTAAERDEWHAEAEARGIKLAELIRQAVHEYLKNHKRKPSAKR